MIRLWFVLGACLFSHPIHAADIFCKPDSKPALIPVELGGVRYNLPAELKPSLTGKDGKAIIFKNPSQFFCIPKTAPDIKDMPVQQASSIHIKGHDLVHRYHRTPKMQLINMHIKTFKNQPNLSIPTAFCEFKKRLKQYVNWQPYSKDPTFQLGTNLSNYKESRLPVPHYLYSNERRFLGLPIVLRCWDIKGEKHSRSCVFQQQLTPESAIWIGIIFELMPAENLGQMFEGLETFLKKYSDDTLPIHDTIPCNTTIGE